MRIAVTLTSSLSVGEQYLTLAESFAEQVAARGHGLVFGGTDYGMMKKVADAYLAAGGRDLVGVMSRQLEAVTVGYRAHEGLQTAVWVETMGERKDEILRLADGIVILPGGWGTFDELATFLAAKANKMPGADKPIAFLDGSGFYEKLIAFLDDATGLGFSKIALADIAFRAGDAKEAIVAIESYAKVNLPDKFA